MLLWDLLFGLVPWEFIIWSILGVIALTTIGIFLVGAWTIFLAPTPTIKLSRTVSTQSQTSYTFKKAAPRFNLLQENDQGIWIALSTRREVLVRPHNLVTDNDDWN